LRQQIRQARGLRRDDGRDGVAPPVRPARCRGLGVEVEHRAPHAALFGGNGQVNRDGRLPCSAFLAQNSDCFHGCVFAPIYVVVFENIHATMQTCNQKFHIPRQQKSPRFFTWSCHVPLNSFFLECVSPPLLCNTGVPSSLVRTPWQGE